MQIEINSIIKELIKEQGTILHSTTSIQPLIKMSLTNKNSINKVNGGFKTFLGATPGEVSKSLMLLTKSTTTLNAISCEENDSHRCISH